MHTHAMMPVKRVTKPNDCNQSGTGLSVANSTMLNIMVPIAQQDATNATLRQVRFWISCRRISQAQRARIPPIANVRQEDVIFVKKCDAQNHSHKPSLTDGVSKNTEAMRRVSKELILMKGSTGRKHDVPTLRNEVILNRVQSKDCSCITLRITRSPRAILQFNNHASATRRASDCYPSLSSDCGSTRPGPPCEPIGGSTRHGSSPVRRYARMSSFGSPLKLTRRPLVKRKICCGGSAFRTSSGSAFQSNQTRVCSSSNVQA